MAELPDDPQNWPSDPFRVLGLEPGGSEADIRRAYTRLIRRFKPEHSPEQFRRVREAYEQVLEMTRWLGFHPPAPPPPSEPEAAPRPESPGTEPTRPPLSAEDAAWALATEGNPAGAYSQLAELSRTRPDDPNVALRLYWLLTVHPGLDTERSRHGWLAAALTRGRLSGPAVELYRRELEANPGAAVSGPYLRLLETDASSPALLFVAGRRLGAAAADRAWVVVDVDLAALSDRVAALDQSAWLSYLVAVMGHLVFEPESPAHQRCELLLAGLRHLELREAWAFDRLEEQREAARAWRQSLGMPEAVREAVREAWSGSAVPWRGAPRRAVRWAAGNPTAALDELDRAAFHAGNRPALATFARLLEAYPRASAAYPSGVVRGLVHEFVTREFRGDYRATRPALLSFLVAEVLDPEELVRACEVAAHDGSRSLAEGVRHDPVLRLTWLAATAGSG